MNLQHANRGRSAENMLRALFSALEGRGLAKIEKLDPPLRVLRHMQAKVGDRIQWGFFCQQMESPFLDFHGMYRHRPVALEVKDIDAPRLPINVEKGARGKGLKKTQVEALRQWESVGVITACVWFRRARIGILKPNLIQELIYVGAKSVAWESVREVLDINDLLEVIVYG